MQGELTVQLDREISVLSKGSFLFIPKMVVHAFANNTNDVVKLLVVDTLGGLDKYYDELQAAFGNAEAINQDLMREIQLKYDTYPPDYVL